MLRGELFVRKDFGLVGSIFLNVKVLIFDGFLSFGFFGLRWYLVVLRS